VFGITIALAVMAVLQVGLRSSGAGGSRQARDYTEWTDDAQAGYVLYKSKGCNSCHRVLRMGENGVAPVLDGEGTRRSPGWLKDYFADPGQVVPGSAHDGRFGPDFRILDETERKLLAEFMASLKANPGSSNYPVPPGKADREK